MEQVEVGAQHMVEAQAVEQVLSKFSNLLRDRQQVVVDVLAHEQLACHQLDQPVVGY